MLLPFNYINPSLSLVYYFLTIHLFHSTNPPLHLYTEPRLMSSTEVKTYRKKERKKERMFRTQDDSYPGWTIRTQWFRHLAKGWTFRTQELAILYAMHFFLNFYIIFGIFASKIVRFIQPMECWSIRTLFCSFPILDLVFFTCMYSPIYV